MRVSRQSGSMPEDPLPLKVVPRVLNKIYSVYLSMTRQFLTMGDRVSIHYTTSIRNPRFTKLGSSVIVDKDVWLHSVQPTKGESGPKLIIDDQCVIGRRSHVAAKNHVHLERDVIVGSSVLIQDHAHQYEDVTVPIRDQGLTEGGRIQVGQGSWIGQGAVIFCGRGELTLGRNCVVSANAVVTRSFPSYSVVSGNPARVVKQFDQVNGIWTIGVNRSGGLEAAREKAAGSGEGF